MALKGLCQVWENNHDDVNGVISPWARRLQVLKAEPQIGGMEMFISEHLKRLQGCFWFFLELSPDEDVDDEIYLEKCWEISTPSLAIFCSDWSKAYCHKFLNRCVHSAARRCFCRFDFSFSLQTLLMLRQSTKPEMLGSKVAASPRVCVTLFVCLYTCSTYALVPSSCRCNVGPAQFAWHWSQTPA